MGLIDSIIGGIESAFNIGSSILNTKYNKEVQKETWRREDTAVQRRAADLKAAGINPLLAAGSAASTSSPIQVGTPRLDTAPAYDRALAASQMIKQKQDIALTEAEQKRINAITRGQELANQVAGEAANLHADIGGQDFEGPKAMALWQMQTASANARAAESAAKAASIAATQADREAKWRSAHGIYGSSTAEEYAAMSSYLDSIESPGQLKGVVLETLPKLLNMTRKRR